MSTVRMFQLIQRANTKLTDVEAEELVGEFEKLVYQRFDDRKELLATKVDITESEKRLTEQITATKVDIAELEGRLAERIASTKVDMSKDINRVYRSLLFWIVITGLLSGILSSLPDILATFS